MKRSRKIMCAAVAGFGLVAGATWWAGASSNPLANWERVGIGMSMETVENTLGGPATSHLGNLGPPCLIWKRDGYEVWVTFNDDKVVKRRATVPPRFWDRVVAWFK